MPSSVGTVNYEAPVGARDEHDGSEDDHAKADTGFPAYLEKSTEIL